MRRRYETDNEYGPLGYGPAGGALLALAGLAMGIVALATAFAFVSPVRAETVGETEVENIFVVEHAVFANGILLHRSYARYPDILACKIMTTIQALNAGAPVRPACLPAIIDEMGAVQLIDMAQTSRPDPEPPSDDAETWVCPAPDG